MLREVAHDAGSASFEAPDLSVKLRYVATLRTDTGDIVHQAVATIASDGDFEWVTALWTCHR